MTWSLEVFATSAGESPDCSVKDCRTLARHHCTMHYEIDGNPRIRYGRVCDAHLAQTRAWYEKLRGDPPIPAPADADAPKPAAPPPKPPRTWPIPEGATPTTCRSCATAIHWVLTAAMKRMPIDAFGATAGQSHFVTCPDADEHRKPRHRA